MSLSFCGRGGGREGGKLELYNNGYDQYFILVQSIIQEGELVALCCPQYNERPQIGEALSCSGDKVHLKWYDGTWTSKWKVYTYIKNRKKVAWEEEVDIHHIVKRHIKLTPSGKLGVKVKEELKNLYQS